SALWPELPASADSAAIEPPQRSEDDDRSRPSRVIEPERSEERIVERSAEAPQSAVVLPLTKSPMRSDSPPPLAAQALSGLDRLLRLAAARGASTLYLSSGVRP